MKEINKVVTGYKHPSYAKSLEKFGIPVKLPKSNGWILKRQIPRFADYDGMGCYPLFSCQDWSQLFDDLENIRNDLVCLSAVIDPFGEYDPLHLSRCFKDVVIPFKEHFIVDLNRPLRSFVSEHHRRYARKSLKVLQVERCENPPEFIDLWVDLYASLIRRHNIKGILAFSKSAFYTQLNVPGIVVFQAIYEDTTVGMLLWYLQNDVAYYHLGAFSGSGYELRASFGLFWTAIEYFANEKLRWLDLGAGAGVNNDSTDGLTRFKQGWSTDKRTTYFCGRIFDRAKYSEIVKAKNISDTDYFPAYRSGEFK